MEFVSVHIIIFINHFHLYPQAWGQESPIRLISRILDYVRKLDYMKYPKQTQWVTEEFWYKRGWLYRRTKLLTKLMFESKLIWMYFQSNSIPLAPTHRGRHLGNQNKIETEKYNNFNNKNIFGRKDITAYLDITSSAVAQPIAATMILYSPLPGLRDITRWRPSRSARSTVAFINS